MQTAVRVEVPPARSLASGDLSCIRKNTRSDGRISWRRWSPSLTTGVIHASRGRNRGGHGDIPTIFTAPSLGVSSRCRTGRTISQIWRTTFRRGGARSLVFQTIWYFGPAARLLPEHFGLRMNGGRRTILCWEINEPTWRELKLWLDAAKAHAGPVVVPIIDASGFACR